MLQTLRQSGDFTPSLDPSRHVSMFSFMNTITRLISGLLSDYMSSPNRKTPASRIPLFLILASIQTMALFILAYAPLTWLREWFILGTAVLGLGSGGIFPLAPPLVSVVWGVGGF